MLHFCADADNRVILSDYHGREKIYMNASYIDVSES